MGASHSGGHFTANYKNCVAAQGWLGKHANDNGFMIKGLWNKVNNAYSKGGCLTIILDHNKGKNDGGNDHKSTIPNPMSYVPPPIKNVDTSTSDGDEGGAVFVYVLVAGVLFVGFMWYEGGL